uniref:MobA/MobL family protein n=1 Tax=Psychrobacter sanguinis TaxID=861445 RepID=UPI0019199BFF
ADRKAELKAMRERWEATCNAHLEKAGSQERISMKSLKEQGTTREPINFSMAQMSNPETEAFKYYVKLLELKEASEEAELQAMLELGSSVKAELNLQTARQLIRQEEEAQRQAEAEAIAQQQARAEAIFDEMEAEAIAQQEATTSYTELLDRIDASRIRYDVKQQLKTIVQATEARFREDPPTQQDKYRQISEKIDELEQQRIIDNDRGAER